MLDHSRQLTLRAWYGTTSLARLSACLRVPQEVVLSEAERLGLRSPTKASLTAIAANEQKEDKAYRKRNLAEMAEAARLKAMKRAADEKAAYEARKEKQRTAMIQKIEAAKAELKARNDAICAEYPFTNNRDLAKKYNTTVATVVRVANIYGVKKSADYKTNCNRKNANHAMNVNARRTKAMLQAADLLRAGDHLAALDVLEAAL